MKSSNESLSNLQNPEEREILKNVFRACLKSSVWDFTSGFRGGNFFDLDELAMGAFLNKEGKKTYEVPRGVQNSRELITHFAQKIKGCIGEYSLERCAFIDRPIGRPVGMLLYKDLLAELIGIGTCIVQPRKRVLHAAVKGAPVRPGERFAVVSDVATTGLSIYAAAKQLIRLGGEVPIAFVLFDREQGARENLSAVGIKLLSLVRQSEAAEQGLISKSTASSPNYMFLGQQNISFSGQM
ncbi:MAG: hypothetical protein ABR969_00835 [Sedimentisphaerales bacterium]|jgi:hypothetical protein